MLKHLNIIVTLGFCYILQYYAYAAYTRFTNVECKAFDKPFADFKQCNLKVLGRGIIGLSMHVRLYQVPVNNVTINLSVLKKFNGYRPFLYNQTVDFCKIMQKMNGPMTFIKLFINTLQKTSNINHTCPYDHDIIVKDLVFLEEYLQSLPAPSGDYKFQLKVAAYNNWKALVNIYLSRKE